MIQDITTNIMVEDVEETVRFYNEVLWFWIIFTVDDQKNTWFWEILETWNIIFAQVWDEKNKIMIQQKQNLASEIKQLEWVPIWASMSFYITVEDIDTYYKRYSKKWIIIRDLETSWYGMKEFVIKDNSWYILMIGEQDKDFVI